MTGSFPLTIESPEAIAMQVVNSLFYGLPLEDLQKFRERVNAVTPDDIQRVASCTSGRIGCRSSWSATPRRLPRSLAASASAPSKPSISRISISRRSISSARVHVRQQGSGKQSARNWREARQAPDPSPNGERVPAGTDRQSAVGGAVRRREGESHGARRPGHCRQGRARQAARRSNRSSPNRRSRPTGRTARRRSRRPTTSSIRIAFVSRRPTWCRATTARTRG